MTPDDALARARAWIDGQPGEAGHGRWVLDPSSAEPLAWVRYGDVGTAVASATAALGPWQALPRRERARALRRVAAAIEAHRHELAALQSLENGKLYRESLEDDLPDTAEVFDYYAGWVDKLQGDTNPVDGSLVNLTVREPVGVCALVVPWNFPLLLAAWKLAPALAMGNAVVLKPSEFTPLATLRMVELLRAELPDGVVQVVVGDGEVGQALVSHPGVAKVSFTGSTAVGRAILGAVAASNLATVTLELGGNAPNIVFGDVADLDAVVDRHAQVLFSQKGEKCTEPARLIVERSVHEAAVERLVAHAEGLRCGHPFDPAATQGPQCTLAQFGRIQRLVEEAVDHGAVVRCGGSADPLAAETGGWYLQATVLDEVAAANPVDAEEVFGPVCKVSVFDTEDEAVALANGTPFGLAAGVNSGDLARAQRVAARLDAGQVFVNRYGCYDFAAPFGGFKASGWGKEMGRDSLLAYTRTKSVWIDTSG
ncbi:MAG: aldehyde dehydrogenase family protein [Acidimicrobiales bacterium]